MADPKSPFGDNTSASTIADSALVHIVDSYVRYYAQGRDHTARAKKLDLDHFLNFLAEFKGYSKPEKLRVSDWDFSSVQRFVDDSLDKGEAPTTVARRLATVKHMGRTLSEKIAGFVNPAREVKTPAVRTGKPKALSKREISDVRKRAKNRLGEKSSFIRLRNQTIFDFLIDTGLRAEEVRALKLSQLDEDLEWIKNVRTKGRRYRNVYITSDMRPKLEIYLEARKEKLKEYYQKLTKTQSRSLPLFISTYNAVPDKPESFLMGAKTLWRAINELSADTHLHPHLLRHSYAMDLLKSSKDVRLVAQALGHSDVRITMRYTERMDDEIAQALEESRSKKVS
jgi:integrase/recombinase XerC